MRDPIKELPFKIDLTVPVDTTDNMFELWNNMQRCFGKEWDITEKDCQQCASKDVCGIIFKDLVDKKAKELETELGSKFLDTEDLANVTGDKLLSFI